MYRSAGACTSFDLRHCEIVRHDDATMKSVEGMIEKNNCSNWRLKSKRLLFSFSSALFLSSKNILSAGCTKDAAAPRKLARVQLCGRIILRRPVSHAFHNREVVCLFYRCAIFKSQKWYEMKLAMHGVGTTMELRLRGRLDVWDVNYST